MKTPRFLVAFMLTSLAVVAAILSSGSGIEDEMQKNRIGEDLVSALKMSTNTFTVAHKPNKERPSAPSWGSFQTTKSETKPNVDKNEELLKGIVKKVTDKLKANDKKKKAAAKRRPRVKLIANKESRVDRALRKLDEGNKQEAPTPAVYTVVKKKQTRTRGR